VDVASINRSCEPLSQASCQQSIYLAAQL
jgi:hypothetical protein